MNTNNDITEQQNHLKRIDALYQNRKQVLALPAARALDAILEHPQPAALVHSFAEEDLFFLVHDIGSEDAREVIALASSRQWEYMLDVETWTRDRIDFHALTGWLNLLLTAAPQRFVEWAMDEHPELIEYYLFNTIEVIVREHDQDPSDFDDGYMTYDDIFYIRLPDEEDDRPAPPGVKARQKEFLARMLDLLAGQDHLLFQETLFRTAQVIPSESEEEAYRMRNVRLAEKGFLPFHEAVGVYQPLRPDQLKKRDKKILSHKDPESIVPAPIHHASLLDGASIFSQALSCITMDDILHQLQVEFAGVCNQLIAADGQPIRNRRDLEIIVKKACGYISIGLERLSQENPDGKHNQNVQLIKTYPLIDLFRTGYGLAADLRIQAKKWEKTAWYAKNHLPLNFWGEHLTGVIGGVLIPRPKYYNNYQNGILYREFETLEDIRLVASALKEAMICDELLSKMTIHPADFPKARLVTCQNLLMTLWARQVLGLPEPFAPIPVDLFKPFLKDLWESGKDAKKQPRIKNKTKHRIKDSKKTDFLKWLSVQAGQPEHDLSQALGLFLERLFEETARNLAEVSPGSLDPRFVQMFLLH